MADYAERNPYSSTNQADSGWPGNTPGLVTVPVGCYADLLRSLDVAEDFELEVAYEFPDPGWRPADDFTGEWVGEHEARLAVLPRGALAPNGPTAATLRAAMGADLPLRAHPTLVADFNSALLAAGATTVPRAAMFCAQVGHESLGLKYFSELWGPTAQQRRYEPVTSLSKQLGNTQDGDGSRFRGRGPIQLTGRGGYATFLAWCREQGYGPPDLLADPGQVATSRWGFLAASHYWKVRRPRLNAVSDAGDVVAATKLINGGTYGLEDRRRRYQACLRLGTALLPASAGTPAAPPAPGGIETMGFRDRFRDWAGNDQTVESWMNNVDKRLAGLADMLLKPSLRSRVDGKNYTPSVFLEATHGDVNAGRDRLEDRIERVERKIDAVLEALAKR